MTPRILVLEASLTVRMDLRDALEPLGLEAVLFAEVEHAREAARADRFDAAVIDVMPDGSGLSLVAQLRAAPDTADLPIALLLSDQAHDGLAGAAVAVDATFHKPYDRDALVARMRALATRHHRQEAPTGRILAVDDSRTFLEWLASGLSEDGYAIVSATTGEQALALLHEEPFDAVLLDVVMPGMSGHETCRRIKANPKWRSIPVMILTAHDDRDAMIEGINVGADDWVAKTGELDILRARLRAQVRRRRFELENARMREELLEARLTATEARAAHRLAIARAELLEQVRAKNEELERANRHLQALARQNRIILETAAEGICGLDTDGCITFANDAAAQTLGLRTDELCGRKLHDLVHADADHPAQRCPLLEPIATGIPRRESEHCFELSDGQRIPIEYVASPMVEGDELLGIGLLFRDVSTRRALEEQLRHAQKMEVVGRLAGGVAHDFNNLLTAIQGYGSVLEMKLAADDPRRGYAQQILASCKRAASLTRQLLAFSRRQVVNPRVLEPNPLVADMEPMLQQLVGGHNTIELELAATGRIKADPGQLEQVVLNLVLNARDAMPSGGRITVRTRDVDVDELAPDDTSAGPWLVFTVQDEGEGIPEDVLDHVFEPFFTTRASGTGLGLSTVHGIVEQNGGRVRIDSRPGEGARFDVWFPRLAATRRGASHTNSDGGGESILVVDDQDVVRAFVAGVLEERGYDVTTATDGHDALRVVHGRGEPFDLLVSDVVMPGMSGQELAAQLRDRWQQLRVLFISGYTAGVAFPPNLSEGDVDFMPKPFSAEDLAARVRGVLDRVSNATRG